ncbi:MAG: ProQ/FINO family protein [Acetobacteraceae bacterium]
MNLAVLLANRVAQIHAASEPLLPPKKRPKVGITHRKQPRTAAKYLIRLTRYHVKSRKPPSNCASWAKASDPDDWRALAVGVSRHIRTARRAKGKDIDRKTTGIIVHRWTMQSAYLRALACGVVGRNLDGSEAHFPDDAAWQYARKMLQECAARQADKERQQREKRAAREIAL